MKRTKNFNTLYCNFFAGPGSGKSTMMGALFAELKWRGIDCEMVTEYAKDKVWEGSPHVLACQPYIFGKQLFRLFRLNGKVRVVITDSPILLSPIYDRRKSKAFLDYVIEEFKTFRNFNIFLNRLKKYNPNGRTQSFSEATKIDKRVKQLLIKTKTRFVIYNGEKESVKRIADSLEKALS